MIRILTVLQVILRMLEQGKHVVSHHHLTVKKSIVRENLRDCHHKFLFIVLHWGGRDPEVRVPFFSHKHVDKDLGVKECQRPTPNSMEYSVENLSGLVFTH